MNMTKQIQDVETVVQKLDKKYDELTLFMLMAKDGMDTSADEPEYLSFWDKHNRLSKMRRDVGFKLFTANAYLSVKRAEARVVGIFV